MTVAVEQEISAFRELSLERPLVDRHDSPAWLTDLLIGEPFAGRTMLRRATVLASGTFEYAVAVPVRNESEILPRMLAALLGALRRVDKRGMAVFAVNDTRDGSAAIIEDWLMQNALSGVVLDVDLAADIRTAPHTRRLAMDVAQGFAPTGVLLTTDADSEVGPGWVRQGLRGLAEGFDLVCEDVRLDAAGIAALPDHVRLAGDAEREYYAACDLLWRRWSGGQAGAFAHRASGASMAIYSRIYRALGGLPLPAHGEDAALCAMVLASGGNVCTMPDGGTRTSARLDGRAAGGCGAALSKRANDLDPECDGALVSVEELRRLAAYRLRHGHRDERDPHIAPLRFSEVVRELALAQDLLALDHAG